MKINLNNIKISINKNQDEEILKEIEFNGLTRDNIKNIKYLKRSIDGRSRNDIKFIYNIEIELKKDININKFEKFSLVKDEILKKRVSNKKTEDVIVIGTGPAGLFAALRLVEYGYKPLIFERGEKVEERDRTTKNFILTGNLNENSNIQFGEGGAGTYSDGKLTTRVRSEYIDKIFNELIENGAQEEIFWNYKPHIGTDVLKKVVKNLRDKIIKLGGKFYFDTLVEDIIIENFKVKGIKFRNVKTNIKNTLETEHIILAIGHSSRDTYLMLHKNNIYLENKPFAIGLRIEHKRIDIDKMQYGKQVNNKLLEAATYNITFNNKIENRGVYSFCMCPGGEIVNASSEKNRSLVNGMSYSTRSGNFSNSAIVVGISKKDYGDKLFDGMKLQDNLEKKAYDIAGNGAVYQNSLDFLKNSKTSFEIESSYRMKLTSDNFKNFFPDFIKDNLHLAIENWYKNKKLPISENVNLIGPETRTSAPLKILRDERGESISTKGLYPIGEGAGYAGGIVSAAIDGLKIVDLIFSKEI